VHLTSPTLSSAVSPVSAEFISLFWQKIAEISNNLLAADRI
jgi:hypothetical protein